MDLYAVSTFFTFLLPRPNSRYLLSLPAPYDWWEKSNVTTYFRRRTSDKICQYEKSQSSLFPRYQHETTILVLQQCRIRVSTSSTSLLLAVRTSRATTGVTTWDRDELRPVRICNFCSRLHETGTNSKTGNYWSYITFLRRLFNILFANCPNWYTIYAN